MDRSQLRVHYQPRMSLNGDVGLIGFEALVRWEHPDRGLIAPTDFIPLAEETGMVSPIGEFVLEQALRQIVNWRRLKPDLTVSVNLSSRQLDDTGLASTLAGVMRSTDVDPGALCLEVSESAITRNPEGAGQALTALKAVGVELAIDDYGTGSSSLRNLKQLPVDALKIHESFVTGLGGDPEDASIVGAVVELGHALGLIVIAEGVETDSQLAELRSLGCDAAQGFLLGRPVTAQEVQTLLIPH